MYSTRNNNIFPTHPFPSDLPSQVDLNFNEAIPSSHPSSHNTVTIPNQDFPVFNTDSTQSPWLPSSSPSQPAASEHRNHSSSNFAQPPQQDFVLFDQPEPQRTNVNRTVSSPAPVAAAFGSLDNNRHRRSSHNQSDSVSPSLQNQRVAQIIQATGHQISSSAFTNRFNSPAQNQSQQQFYASFSAPSSTATANQQNRPPRPPVPLFTEGIGSQQHQNHKMDLHDALSLEDFPPLDGGASTTAYSSPGIPAYDMNVSSASSTNLGTVSPQDLLRDFTSAPTSTSFTNLTSPSIYNESPEFTDSLDVSPAFDNADFGGNAADSWFPLFPQENNTTSIAGLDQSPALETEELDVVEKMPRRKSSNSPSSTHTRHSSVSGVNSRRRDKPLPPIIVDDPTDTIAMKRARNTLAARKSRERKAQRMEEYEEKIAKLTQERDHWKRIALGRNGSATG
ncbi:General control protein [Diatrype stigma]|uniref:Cross-pathway control protein 1 n=1 Tax=Diatrype stigma TaxID=117547 RepID=A0AAN9UTU1_9PEZI